MTKSLLRNDGGRLVDFSMRFFPVSMILARPEHLGGNHTPSLSTM
jgi:hypothetical protein